MLGYNYHIPHDDRRKAQGTEGHRTDVGLLGCFPGRRQGLEDLEAATCLTHGSYIYYTWFPLFTIHTDLYWYAINKKNVHRIYLDILAYKYTYIYIYIYIYK